MNLRSSALLVLLCLSAFFVSSCARMRHSIMPGEAAASDTPAPETKEAPFELVVDNAFIEQGTLHVKVILKAKTAFAVDEVVVSLVGLSEGKVVDERVKPISELVPGSILEKGQSVALFFNLPAEKFSEYQARCSWGHDAAEVLAVAKASPLREEAPVESRSENHTLSLEDVQLVEQSVNCSKPPCDIYYTVLGTLKNGASKQAGEIDLAVGLYWENTGQTLSPRAAAATLNPNEESVSLKGVIVGPGAKKKLRVAIDRAVPKLPGGRFVPQVRIFHYSLKDASS